MKCVVADWEIRNLGCKTLECTVEKNDDKEALIVEIERLQSEHNAEYIVIKNSHEFAKLNWAIQDMGFIFVEDQLAITLKKARAKEKINQLSRMFRDVSWQEMTLEDLTEVYKEMERGIFSTDRIALDPYFGLKVANRRYIGWIKDVMTQGAKLFLVKNKGREIGFFLSQRKGSCVQGILSGLYKNDNCVGMGGALIYAGIQDFISDENVNYYRSSLSSNNLAIIKLDLFFGFDISGIDHVFVKHYD